MAWPSKVPQGEEGVIIIEQEPETTIETTNPETPQGKHRSIETYYFLKQLLHATCYSYNALSLEIA